MGRSVKTNLVCTYARDDLDVRLVWLHGDLGLIIPGAGSNMRPTPGLQRSAAYCRSA